MAIRVQFWFLFFAAMIVGCNKSQPPIIQTPISTTPAKSDDSSIIVRSQPLLAKFLKAPSTAKFAPNDEWEENKLTDDLYRLRGWVDSQNTYGAMLRNYFTAEVRCAGAWRVTYLKFDDTQDAFGDKYVTEAERKSLDDQRRMKYAAIERDAKARLAQLEREQAERAKADAEATQRAQAAKLQRAKDLEERRAIAEENAKVREEQRAIDAKARDLALAIRRASYRKWTTLGGTKASEAKIDGYAGGDITLKKRDGKTVERKVSSLSKTDREYVDKWLSESHVGK